MEPGDSLIGILITADIENLYDIICLFWSVEVSLRLEAYKSNGLLASTVFSVLPSFLTFWNGESHMKRISGTEGPVS